MVIPFIVWVALIFAALVILLWFFPVTLWFQAILSGVRVSLLQLVLMRWRGVNPNTIVMALITGTKAGLTLGVNAEIFLLPNFSFCTELSYAHHGENNYTNPKTEQKNSFSADYLYTDYTVRWYPIKQLNRLSVFGGVSMGTLFAASVNGEKVKHELNSGNVSIPLGIDFAKGKIGKDISGKITDSTVFSKGNNTLTKETIEKIKEKIAKAE